MIEADAFIDAGRAHGFSLYTGVPCSYLKPFINTVIDSDDLRYVGAANEGDAVAIAAGAELAGRRAVVMMQNSGLGNAVSPLTSLAAIFRIPMLLIVTLRGQPGGPADEPQHALMGAITTRQLELMGVPWEPFPTAATDIAPLFERIERHLATGRAFALVMAKGSVAPRPLRAAAPEPRSPGTAPPWSPPPADLPTRGDVLAAVQRVAGDEPVIATTGYTGRELYALDDRANQLYMVGSMGCCASLALGVALSRPDRQVTALDGDGAALMRLGALAVVGHEAPPNLTHILLDNGLHESTGGQSTVSASTDFAAIAAAGGYAFVYRTDDVEMFARSLALAHEAPFPSFIHIRIRAGVPDGLPRPSVTPPEVARRFRAHLAAA